MRVLIMSDMEKSETGTERNGGSETGGSETGSETGTHPIPFGTAGALRVAG
jgi:hypothetical protein